MTAASSRHLAFGTGWTARGMIVMLAFAMLIAWPTPAVEAAPPEVDASVEFVIGSEVGHTYYPEDPWDSGWTTGVLNVDLGGFDDAYPPAEWSVTEVYAGMEPLVLADGSIGAAGTEIGAAIPVYLTDYDDDFGGGVFRIQEWVVDAENGEGEAQTQIVDAPIVIVQEDGTNARFDAPEPGVTVETRRRWRTSSWDGWLGGHTAWTTTKWARLNFTATVSEGQVIALVMPLGENRGEARIKLDGVTQGKVDTYTAGPRRHRIIMWQTPPLSAGAHTIQVINLATDGHPRIDVDAFLVAGA